MSFNEWKEVKLKDICDYKTGKLNSNAAEENGVYPFFTCSPEPYKINSYSFDQDAILLAGNNANGKFHINYYNGKFDAYQRTYVMTSNNEVIIDNTYLYYYLYLQLNHLKEISVGSATRFLTKGILDNIVIKYPKYDEMKYIGKILRSIDEKIELNNQMNKTLEEMAKALFKRWFIDFEFPNEDGEPYKSSGGEMVESELGMIPKGWSTKLIGDVCDVKGGKRLPKGVSLMTQKNSHPYKRVRDMNNSEYLLLNSEYEYVDDETQKSIARYIVSERDVIVSIVGTIGLVSKVHKSLEGANLTENCVKITNVKEVSTDYMYLWLTSKYGQDTIKKMTVGAVQAKLPIKNIQTINILVPTDEKVLAFQRVIESISLQIQLNLEENQTLIQSRDTLLPKLMSGEIRVTNLQS